MISVVLAHSGEFHATSLIAVAPLLVVVLVGVVMLARGARSGREEQEEQGEPPGREQ